MRIAFAIVSLFPGGGLQRDCIEIAKTIRSYGHDVTIYTAQISDMNLAGDIPVVIFPNSEITNHQKQRRFAIDIRDNVRKQCDLLVGFDKLMDLDILYCADASIYYRMIKRPLLFLLPRYRAFLKLEGDSFARDRPADLMLLGQNQLNEYRSVWQTEHERMILLPPTISSTRRKPEHRHNGTRQRIRAQLNLKPDEWVWITIGVQPRTKGIDRIIQALPNFPDARLLIAGIFETSKTSGKLADQARTLGVSSRISWLGHREDITTLLSAADLMLHPARYDTTGTVILEAIINGVPVVTSAACGYASHVEAANAGIVINDPFDFQIFLVALDEARDAARCAKWSESGIAYGENARLYQGRSRASEVIINAASAKRAARMQGLEVIQGNASAPAGPTPGIKQAGG